MILSAPWFSIKVRYQYNISANMEKGETEIMVPMTNTLLIRGKMVDAPMMVELGGGILMEKNTEGSQILDSNLI